MKKFLMLFICLLCFTGCLKDDNKKEVEIDNSDVLKDEVIPESPEEIIPPYVDDNPIKVGLYVYSNGRRFLADVYESAWPIYTDINGFTAYFSNEKEISNQRLQTVWKSLYDSYTDISDYKIGYHVKFSTTEGDKEQTILKPSDGISVYEYIQVYLYDDIHQTGSWYSHIEDNAMKEDTILTTIKLTTSTKIANVTSDIYLTVFTYNGEEDFDENGNYRGNSTYTTTIRKK